MNPHNHEFAYRFNKEQHAKYIEDARQVRQSQSVVNNKVQMEPSTPATIVPAIMKMTKRITRRHITGRSRKTDANASQSIYIDPVVTI